MVWMTLFHFAFDLSFMGYWKQDFLLDPVWTLQRSCIVGLFLFCAGLGQAVAWKQQQTWHRFFQRWVQIAGCAVLVTAGSYAVFPESFIYFGVLHGLTVMLLLVRATSAASPMLLLATGAVCVVLPMLAEWVLGGPAAQWSEVFNAPALNWLGLISSKPFTEDYIPLLPWLGMAWWGMAAGKWFLTGHQKGWMQPSLVRFAQPLAVLGRWSLSYYMLHQPVLLAALWIYGSLTGRPMP